MASNELHAVHVGDITDLNSDSEWQVARDALGGLIGHVGLTLVTGNHDLGTNGTASDRTSSIDRFFADVQAEFVYAGSVQNSAAYVGDDWLVVGLEFAPRPPVLAWANEIIEMHPDRFVLVVTHAYLFAEGERYDSTISPSQPYHPHSYTAGSSGADGAELWDQLGRLHANIRFIVSGHVPGTYAISPARGDAGNLVWDVVVDFQEVPCRQEGDDGEGYLLVLEPQVPHVNAIVYSPWLRRTLDEQSLELEPL